MITAGIDLGSQMAKGVVLGEDGIAGQVVLPVGRDTRTAARRVLDAAATKAGIETSQIHKTIITGCSRRDVPSFEHTATEVLTAARGINFLFPLVRTVIDIGAEGSRAIKCDGAGRTQDSAKNDKCAAGVGAFVEGMARALEVKLEEMGELSLHSTRQVSMNTTCVVFAESEVVSLIHAKTDKTDIARAIHESIASRATALARRIGIEQDVALIGGTAKNIGLVDALTRHLAVNTLLIPDEPQIVLALGAALLARA